VVVLAFLTGNDVRNNSRALEYNPDFSPFFTLQGGRLVEDRSFRDTGRYRRHNVWKRRLLGYGLRYSRVVQLANEARMRLSVSAPAVAKAKGASTELGLDDNVYRTPVSAEWEDAWSVTEALLDSIGDEVRSRGKRFLVVTLTNSLQVRPDPAVRIEFRNRLGVPDLLYPDRRIAAAGKRDGYQVLTLATSFDAYARANRVFLHGFDGGGVGHWNEIGHELAGRAIAGAVCALPSADPPRAGAQLRHVR